MLGIFDFVPKSTHEKLKKECKDLKNQYRKLKEKNGSPPVK